MGKARCTITFALAIACSAAVRSFAAEPHLVLVAPAQSTPDARRAARELAQSLGATIHVEAIEPPSDPGAALSRAEAAAIVIVGATADAYELRVIDANGRSFAARSILRAGAEAVAREMVLGAGRSMVDAIFAAQRVAPYRDDAVQTAPPEPPAPVPGPTSPGPAPPATSESANAAAGDIALGRPASMRSPASVRIDASFAAANVGASLPVQTGIGVGALWLRSPVQFGAVYTFFPGVTVEGPAASLSLTRHTLALVARLETHLGRVTIGGSLGPFAEAWLRSTRATDTSATALPASTELTAGGVVRGDVAYWVFADAGIVGGASLELSPASPRFRDASGGEVVSANVARARLDLGLMARFR